jgi:hypothetical protein
MEAFGRWLSAIFDRADYLLTLAHAAVLDWAAPMPKSCHRYRSCRIDEIY